MVEWIANCKVFEGCLGILSLICLSSSVETPGLYLACVMFRDPATVGQSQLRALQKISIPGEVRHDGG